MAGLGSNLLSGLGGMALGSLVNKILGPGAPKAYLLPKRKNLFFVNFIGPQLIDRVKSNLAFLCESTDRPKFVSKVEELNQYNRTRLAQSKMQYGDINMTFYDSHDQEALLMWQHYYAFYYGDGLFKNNSSWSYDITTPKFETAKNWGFSIDYNSNTNNSYFFTRIEIYEFYGGMYSKTNIINPKIVNADFDRFDRSSSETVKINFTLKYEGVVYEVINAPLNNQLSSQMGIPPSNQGGGLLAGLDLTRLSAGGLSNIIGSATIAPTGIPNITGITGKNISWSKGPNSFSPNWNDPPCQTDILQNNIVQQSIYRLDPRVQKSGNRLTDQNLNSSLPGPLGTLFPGLTGQVSAATILGGSTNIRNLTGARVLGNLGFTTSNLKQFITKTVTQSVGRTLGINDPVLNRTVQRTISDTMNKNNPVGKITKTQIPKNNRSVF